MKVLELFAGTRSIGRAFERRGHDVFSVDWDASFDGIDLRTDIGSLEADTVIQAFGHPDVVWASPDCTTFSVAAIGHHRRKDPVTGTLIPQTEYARFCDEVNRHVLELIRELKPTYWFIENPRGGLRSMDYMQGLPRYTVTYCQYGDTRMKPTDIWTNHPDPRFKPPCRNGDPCHERAPRGSKSGTQGITGKKARAVIPDELCDHIAEICERKERMGTVIRRLTPRECERLQGFPDDWTRIPWKGKSEEKCPDSPRYKAIGNSMAVPVMAWIGKRIEEADRR